MPIRRRPLPRPAAALLFIPLFAPAALFAAASGADFLLIEPTARAAALGGAYSSVLADPEVLRYNPAGLASVPSLCLATAHASSAGDWSHEWAGIAFPSGAWGLGAEILVSGVQPFELYDGNGKAFASAAAGSQNLMLAAGRSWGPVSLGAGLRYFRSQLHTFSSQGCSADLGLTAAGQGLWSAALAVQNLGAMSAYISDADPLPVCFRGGAQARLPLEQGLVLGPRLDLLGFLDPGRAPEIRAGLEAELFSQVALRAGLQRAGSFQQLSFGAGFLWRSWALDYAFQPGSDLGASHMLELHISSR